MKTKTPAPATAPNPIVVSIALNRIVESSTNPRKVFEGMSDLLASVKEKGVIDPIFVRPIGAPAQLAGVPLGELILDPKRKFEIVYGARRFRAAKLAELAEIPAQVRALTDDQAREIQLIENLQRKDPHPLEEADGIAALLKMEGYTVDVIAEKLAKDRSYIYKRLALAGLEPSTPATKRKAAAK